MLNRGGMNTGLVKQNNLNERPKKELQTYVGFVSLGCVRGSFVTGRQVDSLQSFFVIRGAQVSQQPLTFTVR